MSKKTKKPAPDALVALSDIAIDGEHFTAGSEVGGADAEQVRLAHSAGRVGTYAQYVASLTPVQLAAEAAEPEAPVSAEAPVAASEDAAAATPVSEPADAAAEGNPEGSTAEPAAD